MLLPSFFIFDSMNASLRDIDLPENAFLCYRIKASSFKELSSFSKKLLLSDKKNEFCLLVNLDEASIDFEKIVDSLVPFTFYYNYLKFSYDSPLVIFETGREDMDKYVEKARRIFIDHGYADLDTIILNNLSESKNIRIHVHNNINSLVSEYRDSIKGITSVASSFFFFLDDPEKLPEVFSAIAESEILIQKDLPQTYHFLEENRITRKKAQEMLVKFGLNQEQQNSLNSYQLHDELSETRYKTQITELLSFYKNEYEILPLWYKRLGQIIKVIMGKRTFRSLFSDKVKKYKE